MARWSRHFGDIYCRYKLDIHPQSICPMHTHDVLEIYYFISGNCTYLIEGTEYHLRPHDILFKRPLEAHKLIVNATDVPYERIGITLPLDVFRSIDPDNELFRAMMERPLGTSNRFTTADFGNELCTDAFEQIVNNGETMTRIEFLGMIMLILTEASRVLKGKKLTEKVADRSDSVGMRLIDYTNDHLFSDLSAKQLCDEFFLSYSQINRIFKQYTGSSLNQYVTTKRLLTARDRIRSGGTAADVCYTCGYKDYSTFYRAYVKFFGHSPREDQDGDPHLPEFLD